MNHRNKKIHLRFLLAGIFFAVYGWWFSDGELDINLHQTYLVIEYTMLYLCFGAYLAFCGVVYFTIEQSVKREIKGGRAHYLLTVLPVLTLILFDKVPMDNFTQRAWWTTLFLFLALGGQLLLPFNSIRAVFRKADVEQDSV